MNIRTYDFYRGCHKDGKEKKVPADPRGHWHIGLSSDYDGLKKMRGKKPGGKKRKQLFFMLNKVLKAAKSVFYGRELFWEPDGVYPILTGISVMYDDANSLIAILHNHYSTMPQHPDLYMIFHKGEMMLSGVSPWASIEGETETKVFWRRKLDEAKKENWVWIVAQEILETSKKYLSGLEKGDPGSITIGGSADYPMSQSVPCSMPPMGKPVLFFPAKKTK